MADLEKMALKRDRGYLLRLILALLVGALVAGLLFVGLTGQSFSSCAADAFVGSPRSAPAETSPKR